MMTSQETKEWLARGESQETAFRRSQVMLLFISLIAVAAFAFVVVIVSELPCANTPGCIPVTLHLLGLW